MSPTDEEMAALAATISQASLTMAEADEALRAVLTPEVARDILMVLNLGMVLRPGFADVRALLDKDTE